ncbi:hypothetical protein OS493_024005 [Desmophyllum pertusum]|uniref:SAM dependent carboxyl methyltransferase n=1 Tax=Desmophyllum pertusum TaxID=174260 RepID=A0A9W9ZZA8_9CNID|nr:hypothetical protein OS493_024005 [Desmophyllum pertusum]
MSCQQTEYISSGAGYFTSKFSISEESIKYITPGVIESIKSIPVKADKAFTIAEYGCADGGTSMPLMHACVKELKNLNGNELEVHINYEDMPENDYKSLFYFSQGLLPGPSSYLADFPNVFVSATGTNFYHQCFPSGSVNFGFSCLAVQWLSRKPCNLTKALLYRFSEVPDEKNEFIRQAEKDWERFMLMRARELSKGGKLALIMMVDGEDCNNSFLLYNGLYKVMEGLVKDNIFTEDEMKAMTIPEYFRTQDELIKPFMSDESPVRKAGLTLASLETKKFLFPETSLWQETGDAKLVARMITEQTRAWSNFMFLSALSDKRTSEEKSDILNEVFYRLESEYLHSLKDYMLSFWNAFMIIEKSS